jgi:hypothetical protein
VAVASTSESAGIVTALSTAKADSVELSERAEDLGLFGVAVIGVGAGVAIGLRSVVASTTI